jgi:bifunctional glutamyl/prolyl-tRNA synthetase
MVKGSTEGQKCCVRAKIDMNSNNGTMRDPTMYRCKPETHLHTGDKYKVYPTYDFACPIVDSIEGVTHALRTTEYHDRDEQYMWFCDMLGLRKPYIYEYSRFNLQNTVLSKRRLTWFVDSGKVRGWDDPRFPTVRGILRRGMTVEALKQFIVAQGSSRSVVMMEWDKIWAVNKKFIDDIAPRHTALLNGKTVQVNVKGIESEESQQLPKHPKNESIGKKTVWYNSKIRIDEADALTIKENEVVTFMDWGNLKILKIHKTDDGKSIKEIDAELNLENKDFKKTLKVTWLTEASSNFSYVPVKCHHFDHIIAKSVLDKDEDFKLYCDHKTEFVFVVMGDMGLKEVKKGDIIQISRRGYYICDEPFKPDGTIGKDGVLGGQAALLFNIPEGNKRESPTSYMTMSNQQYESVRFADEEAELKAQLAKSGVSKENKAPSSVLVSNVNLDELNKKVAVQGDLIRTLKTNKVPKEQLDPEIKTLQALKTEFKQASGLDWKADLVLPKVSLKFENQV